MPTLLLVKFRQGTWAIPLTGPRGQTFKNWKALNIFQRVILQSIYKWPRDFCRLTIKGAIHMSLKSGGLVRGVYLLLVETYKNLNLRVDKYFHEDTLFATLFLLRN